MEVKLELERLEENVTYIACAGDVLITEEHSLADIARFLVEQAGDVDEVRTLIEEIAEEKRCEKFMGEGI